MVGSNYAVGLLEEVGDIAKTETPRPRNGPLVVARDDIAERFKPNLAEDNGARAARRVDCTKHAFEYRRSAVKVREEAKTQRPSVPTRLCRQTT